MGVGKYILMLIVMLVLFLSLVNLAFDLPVARYEVILIAILLFVAIIAAVGIYADSNWGYILGVILFALNLLHLVYLYFRISSPALVWYGVTGALGFLISTASIKREEEMKMYGTEKEKEVGKEIGRIEEIPKVEIIKDEKPKRAVKKAEKKPAKKEKKTF